MKPLKLVGSYLSPYSMKMRAVLRFRHLPFLWISRGSSQDREIPPVKVPIIPVLVIPGREGAPDSAMVDSTFEIRKLESMFSDRSIIPPDPAVAFIDFLIEDYADEWMNKMMFHYRFSNEPDTEKASHLLALGTNRSLCGEALESAAKGFARRQVSRLRFVGSNEITAPVIEESYLRALELLDQLLAKRPFLMGQRPATADFGVYGQLSQLALLDPTPAALAAKRAPRIVSWVQLMDDASSAEIGGIGWPAPKDLGELRPLLAEVGNVYAPFLLATARALSSGSEEVECEIAGRRWTQQPIAYQGKCLGWLREAYSSLGPDQRSAVTELLAGTGCEALFARV